MTYEIGQRLWFSSTYEDIPSEYVTLVSVWDFSYGYKVKWQGQRPEWVLSNGHVLYGHGIVCGPRPNWFGEFYTGRCYSTEEDCLRIQEQDRILSEARNRFAGDIIRAKFTLEQLQQARKVLGLDE